MVETFGSGMAVTTIVGTHGRDHGGREDVGSGFEHPQRGPMSRRRDLGFVAPQLRLHAHFEMLQLGKRLPHAAFWAPWPIRPCALSAPASGKPAEAVMQFTSQKAGVLVK
jgi:hypothetical protein